DRGYAQQLRPRPDGGPRRPARGGRARHQRGAAQNGGLRDLGRARLARGSLYAFYFHYLSPEMVGTQRSFEMITMLVIGGEGTLVGPLLGVALLTLLPTLVQSLALYKILAEGLL